MRNASAPKPARNMVVRRWTFVPIFPESTPKPRVRGVQFQIGAVLQHSNTPSLRVAGFEDEDDDEDENEAPHEVFSL